MPEENPRKSHRSKIYTFIIIGIILQSSAKISHSIESSMSFIDARVRNLNLERIIMYSPPPTLKGYH